MRAAARGLVSGSIAQHRPASFTFSLHDSRLTIDVRSARERFHQVCFRVDAARGLLKGLL